MIGGKDIKPSYIRVQARHGKLTPKRVDDRRYLYPKSQFDGYTVEDRGEKSGRASVARARR